MRKKPIRFDWAIKKLLRHKANFVVMEGFLSELILDDTKIEKILKSEDNRQTPDDKFHRVHILTQNSKKELVMGEIQNTYEIDHFHRMAYDAAKVLDENVCAGQAYSDVEKVKSVNIVYFDLGKGKDYVYRGSTVLEGLHKKGHCPQALGPAVYRSGDCRRYRLELGQCGRTPPPKMTISA